jgi:hypothetical protein
LLVGPNELLDVVIADCSIVESNVANLAVEIGLRSKTNLQRCATRCVEVRLLGSGAGHQFAIHKKLKCTTLPNCGDLLPAGAQVSIRRNGGSRLQTEDLASDVVRSDRWIDLGSIAGGRAGK